MNQEQPHVVIRASAGSGKTYQLTQHYLGLLRAGARPDQVLATTFTRKAAGEIFGRVLTTLAGTDSDAQDRELLVELSRNLHRVSVSTIDSFFHRVGMGFRYELDLPLEPIVVDEYSPLAQRMRAEAIEGLLDDAAESQEAFDALVGLLRRLYHDEARRGVTAAIDDIVLKHAEVFRQAPDAALWDQLALTGLLDSAALERAIESLAGMRDRLPTTKAGKPRSHWLNSFNKTLELAGLGEWDGMFDSGLPAKLIEGAQTFDRAEIGSEWVVAFEPLMNHAKAVYVDRIAQQTRATFQLMERFVTRYDALRRQRGVMLYSDITQRLAGGLFAGSAESDALLPEVYFRLDAAVTHLLLDEFQDTSNEQWMVLSPFAEEIVSSGEVFGDDQAASRSLFVVGDTKQAIYGWRGGNPALFDTVESMVGERGATRTLAESRRSSQVVLDAVNQVFGAIEGCPVFDGDSDRQTVGGWLRGYEQHVAFKDLPGYFTLEHTPEPTDASDAELEAVMGGEADEESADRNPSHERAVAERIEMIVKASPGRSIGVLVSTNAVAGRLLHELRLRGVDAGDEGGSPIADSPAVSAMLSAMILADHPGDSASAFHVFNSPLGEVLRMTGADENSAADAARRIRESLIGEGYAVTLAGWATAVAGSCDEDGVNKLTRLVELAEAYETGGAFDPLRPSRFADHAEASRVESPGGSTVRVMTVHKSKGLEFDAVVLPQLDRKLFGRSVDPLVERDGLAGPITGVFRGPKQKVRAMVPRLEAAYEQARAERLRDDLSALYVAMTRAKYATYLLVKHRDTKRLPSDSFGGIVRHAFGAPEDEVTQVGDPFWAKALPALDETPAQARSASSQIQLDAGDAGQRMRPTVTPSSLHDAGRVRGGELLRLNAEALKHGSDVHEQLSRIGYLQDADASSLSPELSDTLKHDAVANAFMLGFEDGAELWLEHDFVVIDGERLLRGAFDRVVVWRDESQQAAKAHLIDFKSDRVTQDSDALAERVETYRPQLIAYRRALSLLLGLDEAQVSAELLFLEPGVSVSV